MWGRAGGAKGGGAPFDEDMFMDFENLFNMGG